LVARIFCFILQKNNNNIMTITWQQYDKGTLVHLDKKYANHSIVEVVSQTPYNMFTKVKAPDTGYEWEVMTNRLSKIEDDGK
jgi:hypothetical protein